MNDLQPVHADGILSCLDAARRALAEAKTIDEVKHLRDQAQAVRHFLKQRDYSFEAQQDAAEIKLRAERRLGQILAETVNHNGSRGVGRTVKPTLPVGVTKTQSHRWQRLASLPEGAFEGYVGAARQRRQELTTAGAFKLAKAVGNAERLRPAVEATPHAYRRLEDLIAAGQKFATLYVDPPWRFENSAARGAAANHYPTMAVEEIAALPVARLAADNAHMHLWTTNAFLQDAFRVLQAWGFAYKSLLVWHKPQLGTGNYWRVCHEFLLLGLRGDCPFRDHSQGSVVCEKRTAHSAKPHTFRKLVELVSPPPRLELFAREPAAGWTVWGNQVELGPHGGDMAG
jgi:N6-adenosine-specific RNA methylase IME4